MSEYQYYEFLAVDRPLSREERDKVRALSTRAEITSTRFVNEYHFGDFHGDPTQLVEQLYDAHLYWANWGSRRLVLRLPALVLSEKTASPYAMEESLRVWTCSGHTLLDFSLDPEDGGEEDFERPWELSSFVGLRAELAAGDLRPLYLAWLAGLGVWELSDDDEEEYGRELEPPVPAGLSELTGPQKELAAYLNVSDDLLSAAAEVSAPADGGRAGVDPEGVVEFVAGLPVAEKDALLVEAALGTGAQPGPRVLARYRESLALGTSTGAGRRSAAHLLDVAYRIRTARHDGVARQQR